MGLDMYLEGERNFKYGVNVYEDGFRLQTQVLELGYWRKYADLHGFIIEELAGGDENCSRLYLETSGLEKIVTALQANQLPYTDGFFFRMDRTEAEENQERLDSIRIFEKALVWLRTPDAQAYRYIRYRASW